ncbi:hypothetical protein [Aquamicrobium soli]|uniref:TniQ protein n=1 Tax=Aquamicrobium soli TaxID=1811518 RepID=A0ABV7KG47_9HYPH
MRSLTDNFDRLFDSLPRIVPAYDTNASMPRAFIPMLQWPLSRPYLGFTPVDRRREHQIQTWLMRGGLMPRPATCSMCGTSSDVAYHAEDYCDAWRMLQVCKGCHRILHSRHKMQFAWLDLINRHSRTGEEWFCFTPLDPLADFAGYLRRRFGPDYTLMRRSIECLPTWVIHQLPKTGLMPLEF